MLYGLYSRGSYVLYIWALCVAKCPALDHAGSDLGSVVCCHMADWYVNHLELISVTAPVNNSCVDCFLCILYHCLKCCDNYGMNFFVYPSLSWSMFITNSRNFFPATKLLPLSGNSSNLCRKVQEWVNFLFWCQFYRTAIILNVHGCETHE